MRLTSGRSSRAATTTRCTTRTRASASTPTSTGARVLWRPYPGVPAIAAVGERQLRHDPVWYRNFLYSAERARGLDGVEDLASPGIFDLDARRPRRDARC